MSPTAKLFNLEVLAANVNPRKRVQNTFAALYTIMLLSEYTGSGHCNHHRECFAMFANSVPSYDSCAR